MDIIPAILPKDFKDFEAHVAQVKGLVRLVQVDICDGKLTPSASWPYKKHDDNFEAIRKEDRGMPFWEEVEYEFDLMVDDPANVADDFVAAGATRIVLHVESKDVQKALDILQGKVEIGLALNMDTPLDRIEPFKEKIAYIQLMGIDSIGFQGQAFDEKVLARVREITQVYPTLPIQIDGGVNLETAKLLKEAGADRLIVGSAIFGSENVIAAIERLKDI